jgi:predicted short-subunit dehydrogenase-like oxidoreductase (DUF2520 family)
MNDAAMTVDLVGSGNVAYHLAHRFGSVGIKLRHVYARDLANLADFPSGFTAQTFTEISRHTADVVVILAVSDDAIPAIAEKIPNNCVVMHTSGSVALNALTQTHRAVLYPLQSFSRARNVDWHNLPIITEASTDNAFNVVQSIAQHLSTRVEHFNSAQRLHLHLAAVMVNNLVNHLFGLSAGYLHSQQLPFDLLHPLIRETAAKVGEMQPLDAQTGPAKRNDQTTIDRHLALLQNHPDAHAVYQLLTEQIIRIHHERQL